MKTLQTYFFEKLDDLADNRGCAVLQSPSYANTGIVEIVRGGFTVVARISYSFSAGHNVFNALNRGPGDPDPIFGPDKANPRMFIAKTAEDLGDALRRIDRWIGDSS